MNTHVPRLRIRGELIELRAADLRFAPNEVATFFRKAMGLTLSAEDVAARRLVPEAEPPGCRWLPCPCRGEEIAMTKVKQLPRRQRIRKASLLTSLLLFPATLYYFSPMLILQGASEGIINGSLIVFALMFLSALFVGRLWCGWACPAGALQEFGQSINDKPTPRGKFNWIKWAIWIPWIGLIVALAIGAGGYRAVNPFYQLETGVTMALPMDGGGPPWFVIYYVVIALILGLAVIFGRRASCHTICWMAPFMIIGRWIRNRVRWPSLRLQAAPEKCIDCQTCTRNCPMSLDVNAMVRRADMEEGECILCGNCVDSCPKGVIRYSFSGGRDSR